MFIFWKQISLVLQIAIVVAAVLLFSFFDPFNFLKSKKLNLENTPINVKSIREIGQLITAEYYGEVLNSLQQSRINQVVEEEVNYLEEHKNIHSQYQQAIGEFIDDKDSFKISRWNKKNNLYDYFYYRFSSLTANPYYQDYMEWLLTKMGQKSEKRLLKYFYSKSDESLDKFNLITESKIQENDLKKITDKRVNTLTADKKFRKEQIVVLGRGWVKAGIDFGKFTNQNFKYDKDSRTIHLIGMQPEILSCTINPWFIPEKQVKGFEVILVSRKANRPKFMQIVKEETLKKLRNNALEANLLQQAKKNAEVNLKDFFSLLIADGIDNVIIHEDFFGYFDVSLKKDSLNPGSMRSIDSLFVRRFQTDSLEVVALRDSLKKHRKIHVADTLYNVQRFSSLLALAEDEELSSGELTKLKSIRDFIHSDQQFLSDTIVGLGTQQLSMSRLDTIWYYPDRKSLAALDELLKHEKILRREKPFSTWEIITNSKKYSRWDSIKTERYQRLIYSYMVDKKIGDFHMIEQEIKESISQVVINNTTFVENQKGVENDKDSVKIDEQKLIFSDDIQKTIMGELLKSQIEIGSATFNQLMDSICLKLDLEKPYLIIPFRDSIQRKYVVSSGKVIQPLSRFTYLLFLTDTNSIKQSIEEEELKFSTVNDSIMKPDLVKSITMLDSIWFYPSVSILGEFNQKVDVEFPKQKFANFFRKAFNSKKHEEWQDQRKIYYYNLIYFYMLNRRSEELERTKSILWKEYKLSTIETIAS